MIRIMLGARERSPVPTSFTTRLLSFNEARARRPKNTRTARAPSGSRAALQ